MRLESLPIRLQSPERQFGKGPVNARRLGRDYASLSARMTIRWRFFYTVRYRAEKIVICRHVSGPAGFAYFISKSSTSDRPAPVSSFARQRRCAIVTSLRKSKSEHRLPYDLTLALFVGNYAQLPPTLVLGAQLGSLRLSLLRVVAQRRPELGKSSPNSRVNAIGPPARTRLWCDPLLQSVRMFAEASMFVVLAVDGRTLSCEVPFGIGNAIVEAPRRLPGNISLLIYPE